ncbi:hypothetical protein ACQEV4_40275 [Streptomyces shenzhenensis]|uniref:hypothetical protein n=1 Tax=Streptomyces shenzhenensis TaxID=943815 RepID=UPI003D91FC55
MNTRAVNAAAGVITAAMQQGRQTPAGIAIALDSARLLNSPEHAAEHEQVRTKFAAAATTVAQLVLERGKQMKVENALRDRVAELEARLAKYERPADEDLIAYALTPKAETAADKLTRLFAPTQVLRAELDGERP